jgi:hypothetical protein
MAERPDPQAVAAKVDASLAREVLKADVETAPIADDATFLRRAWLDVVGDIPTPEHVIAFLLDKSYDKRAKAVRELLADPQYGVNWARYWRDVVFYRRVEDRSLLAANAMEADLCQELNENTTWDKIATDFITATGDVRDNGSAALIMAQDGRTEETTAEVSRIFLGMQIQCAQCHDHPYDRWKREQFHELAAFFPRVGVRPVQSATRRSFAVVSSDRPFAPRMNGNNAERLPTPEHVMPNLEDPTLFGRTMQPKFFLTSATLSEGTPDRERRETLAKWLTENEWFAKAIVNRMWSELAGEGFYEPVDDMGPDRTATAPETLQLLADEFRASGYDVKWLIETICATQAYQRQSGPRRERDGVPFAANVAQPLRADQLYNAMLSAIDANDEPERMQRRPGMYGERGGPRGQFNGVFGYDPSEPRDAIGGSIPQALAMMNSPQVAKGIDAREGSLLGDMLQDIPDNKQLIAELYLRTLNREPTPKELTRAAKLFEKDAKRRRAVEDLTWALLNSAEFRHRR